MSGTATRTTAPSAPQLAGPAVRRIALLLLTLPCLGSCAVTRTSLPPQQAASLDRQSPYLKIFLKSGEVYVLADWSVDSIQAQVSGRGVHLGEARDTLGHGAFTVPLADVALFETNVTHSTGAVAALAVVTGASLILTAYCIANPKACFGSCPTFYVWDGSSSRLAAEGFSASVAPSLEATDRDHLYFAHSDGDELRVEMKNEALETHVVRYVDLLLYPRPPGGRVLSTAPGQAWKAREMLPLSWCRAAEGDCLPELAGFDGWERVQPADSSDLAAREWLTVKFDVPAGRRFGLVVAARHSLLSTWLFYQSLAYMGRLAPEWLARLERGQRQVPDGAAMGRALGAIEVFVEDATGQWARVGVAGEAGPLATNVHLVPLPESYAGSPIRLRMSRGLFRIDYIGLALLGEPVEPLRLRPERVLRLGADDPDARARLLDDTRLLVTAPGDDYTLVYRLPEGDTAWDFMLECRGYYLEWLRHEWLKEEDPLMALFMLNDPEAALRRLAPRFKAVEAEVEQVFWNSRYARR